MSYNKTIKVWNGDHQEDYDLYKCDVTGEEIEEAWPHFYIKNDQGHAVHISHDGFYKLMEKFLMDGCHSGIMPYVMEELLERYCKRKKFNRYIRPEIRKQVLAKYAHKCVSCGREDNLTIDHIVPVVEGGKNDFPNLQVLCKPCNSSKGKKPNDAFMSKPKSNPQ